MTLNLINTPQKLNKALILRTAKETFLFLGYDLEVNLKFISAKEIVLLGEKFKKPEKPIDVLSFETGNNQGDIVICPEVIQDEASKLGYSLEDLILLYFVHGALHLAGFSHEKKEERDKMESAEVQILSKVGVKINR